MQRLTQHLELFVLNQDERFVALRARRRFIEPLANLATLLLETRSLVIDPVAFTAQIFEKNIELALLVRTHWTHRRRL